MEAFAISLVVPNYNNSVYLRKCVESAVQQSYPIKQIIIVDDKSTDESAEVIRALEKEYTNVKGVFLEKNGGVSNARNVGLSFTETEYVTFMDADDYYCNKDKIRNEMRLIQAYAFKNVDILAYSYTVLADNFGIPYENEFNSVHLKNEFIIGKSFCQLVSNTKTKRIPRDYIIKKSILLDVGAYSFYKNLYEDLDLLMRIAKRDIPFYCTFKSGTCYRNSICGLSKQNKKILQETEKEVFELYYSDMSPKEKIKVFFWKIMGFFIKVQYRARCFVRKK